MVDGGEVEGGESVEPVVQIPEPRAERVHENQNEQEAVENEGRDKEINGHEIVE